MRNLIGHSIATVLLLGLPACGGGSADAWSQASPQHIQTAGGAMAPAEPAPGIGYANESAGEMGDYLATGGGGGSGGDDGGGTADQQQRYAQAEATSTEEGEEEGATATDAHSGPLLVYTATVGLAVHQVADKQQQIEVIAREAGGHLDHRTNNQIQVRVPAAQFQVVLDAILELGDVLNRDVRVQDVTEEFHDAQTRVRTLEAMYARVQQLLEDADDVREALAVEQHLERITMDLERLRGRLRFLSDRIAFSTITINFQEQTQVSEPTFELPFLWLRSLGLQELLRLR